MSQNGKKPEELNQIGLGIKQIEPIAIALNELISEYQIHYQNMLGFHWNVKGRRFFELHEQFEKLYNIAKETVDEIAERILTLGFTPFHTMTDYLETARVQQIKEARNLSNDQEIVRYIVGDLRALLEKERDIHALASDVKDIGTYHQLEDYISQQEKTIWMLNSWLNKQSINLDEEVTAAQRAS
ncbi:MAG: DNA starvation/stationary phase protection protein [Ferruginibacter sp.]|nr:DNA starvation/stationary phase protection protein [Cytophagales bacterium]